MPALCRALTGARVSNAASLLLANMIAYWKLDEATGIRNDIHGIYHLTDNNTVGSAAGKLGNAASFVGVNAEYLSLADNAAFSPGTRKFAFSGWIKPDAVGNRTVLSKFNPGDAEFMLYQQDALASIRWGVSDNGSNYAEVISSGLAANGVWTHFVVWHDPDANEIGIAVNDTTPIVAAHATNVFNGTTPFMLGARADAANYFDGLIDEVAYYLDYIPTAADRTFLYGGGTPPSYFDF